MIVIIVVVVIYSFWFGFEWNGKTINIINFNYYSWAGLRDQQFSTLSTVIPPPLFYTDLPTLLNIPKGLISTNFNKLNARFFLDQRDFS